LLLAALGPAQRRGSCARRATAFEVLATGKNQQQNNEQGMDFHFPPLTQTIDNQSTKPRDPLNTPSTDLSTSWNSLGKSNKGPLPLGMR
jgi:hypothetical protein